MDSIVEQIFDILDEQLRRRKEDSDRLKRRLLETNLSDEVLNKIKENIQKHG